MLKLRSFLHFRLKVPVGCTRKNLRGNDQEKALWIDLHHNKSFLKACVAAQRSRFSSRNYCFSFFIPKYQTQHCCKYPDFHLFLSLNTHGALLSLISSSFWSILMENSHLTANEGKCRSFSEVSPLILLIERQRRAINTDEVLSIIRLL